MSAELMTVTATLPTEALARATASLMNNFNPQIQTSAQEQPEGFVVQTKMTAGNAKAFAAAAQEQQGVRVSFFFEQVQQGPKIAKDPAYYTAPEGHRGAAANDDLGQYQDHHPLFVYD